VDSTGERTHVNTFAFLFGAAVGTALGAWLTWHLASMGLLGDGQSAITAGQLITGSAAIVGMTVSATVCVLVERRRARS
jgi:membrane associated rhomboid family serine protease